MSRETSPYVVGDFWLDKRRDGLSPEVWQITRYDAKSRSDRYKSTRCRDLTDAKAAIDAHHQREISKTPQSPADALVVPLLMTYWDEHGQNAIKPGTIAGSLRNFIAFLDQDEGTIAARVADLNPLLFERFRKWRMAAHRYEIVWKGKSFTNDSAGVRGESVQRNLDDVRAALTHHANNGRLPYAPKVPSVAKAHRSEARDRVLTTDELGAMFGFASQSADKDMWRFLALILATAVRPEAAAKTDPAKQWLKAQGLYDLHPVGAPRTKKHNPVVPVIPQMEPVLRAWIKDAPAPVKSRKRAWRTLKRCLGLGADVDPKTIRHTVATRLRGHGVQRDEVESLLGHSIYKGSSAVYAKYDPAYLAESKRVLSIVWDEVMAAAHAWSAVHLRSKVGNGLTIVVAREPETG